MKGKEHFKILEIYHPNLPPKYFCQIISNYLFKKYMLRSDSSLAIILAAGNATVDKINMNFTLMEPNCILTLCRQENMSDTHFGYSLSLYI